MLISENMGTLEAVAEIMLRKCVLGGKGQGSFATGFGEWASHIPTTPPDLNIFFFSP